MTLIDFDLIVWRCAHVYVCTFVCLGDDNQHSRGSTERAVCASKAQCSNTAPATEMQENHCRNNESKMLDKIESVSTKVKNQHEKCQCLLREEGGEKYILKYTFIQSLWKIKQQN